jgi:hypothetical protein
MHHTLLLFGVISTQADASQLGLPDVTKISQVKCQESTSNPEFHVKMIPRRAKKASNIPNF